MVYSFVHKMYTWLKKMNQLETIISLMAKDALKCSSLEGKGKKM